MTVTAEVVLRMTDVPEYEEASQPMSVEVTLTLANGRAAQLELWPAGQLAVAKRATETVPAGIEDMLQDSEGDDKIKMAIDKGQGFDIHRIENVYGWMLKQDAIITLALEAVATCLPDYFRLRCSSDHLRELYGKGLVVIDLCRNVRILNTETELVHNNDLGCAKGGKSHLQPQESTWADMENTFTHKKFRLDKTQQGLLDALKEHYL